MHRAGTSGRVGADPVERKRVVDRAGNPIQCAFFQAQRHERFIRAGERCVDAPLAGSGEPEPGIIAGMTDHDHDLLAQPPAFIEPFLHERSTDAPALVILVHSKRGERCCGNRGVFRIDRDRAEENVADDGVVMHGNKGEIGIDFSVFAQGIDKPGLAILGECLAMHIEDRTDLTGRFRADKKRIHLYLLGAGSDKGMCRAILPVSGMRGADPAMIAGPAGTGQITSVRKSRKYSVIHSGGMIRSDQ